MKVLLTGNNEREFSYLTDAVDWIYDQRDRNEEFCKKIRRIEIHDVPRGVLLFVERDRLDTPCGWIPVKVHEDYTTDWRVEALVGDEVKKFEVRNIKDVWNVVRESPRDVQISPLDPRAIDDIFDLRKAGLVRESAYIRGAHVSLYV